MRRRFGASPWISAVAHLHIGTGTDLCLCRFPVCRLRTDPRFPSRRSRGVPDVFDIYTIIFLALAVFIFLRLRSVLGQRTGRERPPYDPYSARDAVRGATNDNVVRLPGRGGETAQKPVETPEPAERWKGIAEAGSTVAAGLDAVAREDKTFDAKHFVPGPRAAHEKIVLAYAEWCPATRKS